MGMYTKRKLIYGVGTNDADYETQPRINGKQVSCNFYATWQGMLRRCYSAEWHARYPTYIGCSVDPEWFSFMAFKAWMEKQEWRGMQLDKDILFVGNKVYSPATCVFVSRTVNLFIIDSAAVRGDWPIGVSFNRRDKRFHPQCNNPFTKKRENLGYSTCPYRAHQAWKKRKHELACQLADLQTDARVAEALRLRYSAR